MRGEKMRKYTQLLFIFFIIIASSCASYRVYDMDTSRPAHRRVKKKNLKGLIVAVEDYSPENKSMRYFYRDLKNIGYIPIYFSIVNTTDYEFTIKKDNIRFRFSDATEAKVVKVDEVIAAAQSSPAKALLAFPLLIFPTFFIWSSISEANYELEKDYRKKALHDFNIVKDEKIFGFIFIKVPDNKYDTPIKDSLIEFEVIKKSKKGEMAENLTCKLSVSEN